LIFGPIYSIDFGSGLTTVASSLPAFLFSILFYIFCWLAISFSSFSVVDTLDMILMFDLVDLPRAWIDFIKAKLPFLL